MRRCHESLSGRTGLCSYAFTEAKTIKWLVIVSGAEQSVPSMIMTIVG